MRKILIADDQPHVTRVLKLALEKKGYIVDLVHNGLDALGKVQTDPPDVLITDIMMPKMDGRELCKRIARDLPERQFLILVMTSRIERSDKEWTDIITNLDFLEKPLSPRHLLARLDDYFLSIQDTEGALHV